MEAFVQAVYSGALYGSIYGLMALGLTLVWGALRMLNLAHGALYLAGGYFAWTFLNHLHLPLLPAFALAVAGAGLVGALLQAALVHPIVGKPGWDNAALIATVGASIAFESAALLIFKGQDMKIPEVAAGIASLGPLKVPHHRLVVMGIAVLALAAMCVFLKVSRHGLAVRAVAQEPDAARLMGVSVRRTFFVVMGASGALAGLAGILLSSIYGLNPRSGAMPMVTALVVTIFGGLGSVKGTIWAAYVIGLLEAFLQVYQGPHWALPGMFIFMMAMLLLRPSGLFGLGEARRL